MRVRSAFATADAFMTFSFHRESKVGPAESGNAAEECTVLMSTPGAPKAPGREHGLPLLRSCGYSSPRPFPRLCQRGEGSTDIWEFVVCRGPSVSYSCGLIERRRADTPAAQRARHPGSIDCSSDSAVESRVEPEGQDLLDIQDMPSFSAPSFLASLSALG